MDQSHRNLRFLAAGLPAQDSADGPRTTSAVTEHQVARTLVKSAPELWGACSDPESLGRHLAPFGEIRITRLEPESTVAWEGDRGSGTVKLEPSGWGTRVTLTVAAGDPKPATSVPALAPAPPEPVTEPAPAPEPTPEPTPEPIEVRPRRMGLLRRVARFLFVSAVVPVSMPEDEQEPVAAPAYVPEPARAEVAAPLAPVPPGAESAAPPEPAADVVDALGVLEAALDSLGQDHHRPFSRG